MPCPGDGKPSPYNARRGGGKPPLVPELRRRVREWRDDSYAGAADTSKSLLNWWFNTPHLPPQADGPMAEFQYYFAQCEAAA